MSNICYLYFCTEKNIKKRKDFNENISTSYIKDRRDQ